MTFGGFAYGSSAFASVPVRVCPPPSCNLVVMEILQKLKDAGIQHDLAIRMEL